MRHYFGKLKRETDTRIARIERTAGDTVSRSQEAIVVLEDTLGQLKAFVSGHEFPCEQEEIFFFKHLKPSLASMLIYYHKIHGIELDMPLGNDEVQLCHIKKEYEKISDYFERNNEFVHYFRSRSTHLDNCYFVRTNPCNGPTGHDSLHFDRDPNFSTRYDHKVARLMAYERLLVYLREECAGIGRDPSNVLPDFAGVRLTWTAAKVDLIELLYAIHAAGCFNNGKTDIKQLTQWAEYCFNVNLGRNVPRNFFDISIRINPTQFLDRIRQALQRVIDEMNRYVPKRK